MKENRLSKLTEIKDYEVANNDPDIRGWIIVGGDGKRFGTIEEFIVDTEKKLVRYVDVKVDYDLWHSEGERHLIIPVGFLRVGAEGNDKVYLESITNEKLKTTPVYTGGPVTRDYEHSLRESLTGKNVEEISDDDYYNDEIYDSLDLIRHFKLEERRY